MAKVAGETGTKEDLPKEVDILISKNEAMQILYLKQHAY